MRMKFPAAVQSVAVFLVACTAAHGETAIGVGTEYMQWREYRPLPLLEETGFRPFIQLEGSAPGSPQADVEAVVRIYGGDVQYNGQLMNGTPITATTGYTGVRWEAGGAWRLEQLPEGGLSLVLRGGLDWWERNLKGGSGYRERYRMVYLRAGVAEEAPSGAWSARGGLLIPLSVTEDVNLGRGFQLEPKGRPSLYLDFGRRIGASRQVGVAFQRYRFDASDPVSADINQDGIDDRPFQPATEVDVYSVYAKFEF